MFKGLVSAFRTITAIPMPDCGCEHAEDSLTWFPWVGLVLGGVAFSLAWLGLTILAASPLIVYGVPALAALIVTAWALLTRGFHLDGLADMCDGFGGGWTRECTLEIMRDSHIGSFGVIALVLVLLIKTLAVAMLMSAGQVLGLVVAPILSRWSMVYQAVFNGYARKEAPTVSMANHFIDSANVGHFWKASINLALLLAFFWGLKILSVPAAGILVALAWLGTAAIGLLSRSKIGGITGDILGATCELVETLILLTAGFVL